MTEILLNNLSNIIDVSCVKQNHTLKDIDDMILAAKKYQFICTFALPSFTPYLIEKLKEERRVMVGGTVGFPSGCDTTPCKLFQANELINMGCDELDMVINISKLKSLKDNDVYHDIKTIVDTAVNRPVKAIIEVSLLTDDEIVRACKIAVEAGAAYIKTGTGWCSEPTTVDHIKLIKETVKNLVKIKAAGGIRNLKTILEMEQVGCNRFGIGTASAISIMEEANNLLF